MKFAKKFENYVDITATLNAIDKWMEKQADADIDAMVLKSVRILEANILKRGK